MPASDATKPDACKQNGRKQNVREQGAGDSAGKARSVHVRFDPAEGRRLQRPEPATCPGKGPLWTERQVLMERADGTYELIGTSRNLEGLARWVLSFGTGAEVRGPAPLQRQVAATARRVWQQYEIQN